MLILHRETKRLLRVPECTHPLDDSCPYAYPDEGWIHNPVLLGVTEEDARYWIIGEDDSVRDPTAEERAVLDGQLLQEAIAAQADAIHAACLDYDHLYFEGGAYSQLLEYKLAGSSRASESAGWLIGLWNDCFVRKYMCTTVSTVDQLAAYSDDFSAHGAPPWTVVEMIHELVASQNQPEAEDEHTADGSLISELADAEGAGDVE